MRVQPMKQIDFLELTDLTPSAIEDVAERALVLEEKWNGRNMPQSLSGSRIGLIEALPGWRNPTALHLGVSALGGICTPVSVRLEGAEEVEDLAGYLDNWFDLLGIRAPSLDLLKRLANALEAPVLNLRTNENHPCEVLGDLVYAKSVRGSWDGLRIAVVGPVANVVRSWSEAAKTLSIEVIQVAPESFQLRDETSGQRFSATDDLAVCESADLVITDCWPQGASEEEKRALATFRIDAKRMDRWRSDVLFVPCPPVTRGEEVSADAMVHPRCLARPAKAFLMHAQNALVEFLI